MTQYWCIKETGYKLAGQKGISFKDDIIVDPIESGLESGITKIHLSTTSYTIQFFEYDNYIVAFNID